MKCFDAFDPGVAFGVRGTIKHTLLGINFGEAFVQAVADFEDRGGGEVCRGGGVGGVERD